MGGRYGPTAMSAARATASGRRLAVVLVALGAVTAPAGAVAQEPSPDPAEALALDAAETRLRELEGIAAGHAARLGIRPPARPAPETLEAVASRVAELEEVVAFLAGRQELLRPRPRPGASPPRAARPLRRGGHDALAALAERLGLDPPAAARAASPAVAAWLAGSTEALRDAELPLRWPARGRIGSRYGPPGGRMHEGLDIVGRAGQPVVAAAAGTVLLAGDRAGAGRTVVVGHGDGLATVYANLASIAVERGQPVARGQAIGRMGTSGSATGVHLHFGVRVDGAAVDPREHVRPPRPGATAPPGKLGEPAELRAPGAPGPDCPAPGHDPSATEPALALPDAGFACEPAAEGYSRKVSRSSTRTPISSR
jgi:murein DD-endopeptidase MepM/ murein hydrolase activator NlpD